MVITKIIINLQPNPYTMIKIEKSNTAINPFGGINFVIDRINRSGINETIDNQLGKRPTQAQYSYSNLLNNLWSVFFCGGDCAEDLNEHLGSFLNQSPYGKTANSDTVLRVLKTLKTERETITSTTGNTYEINKNDRLNQLNISILLLLNLLNRGQYYDFDYDNEILKTEKYDAQNTYKHCKGYFPGMATINGMPVYFENRDGNMSVKTNQDEVLDRCFNMLESNDIRINRSRMDAGSYSQKIVDVVARHSRLFYIRANRCDTLTDRLLEHKDWKKAEINHINYEVCSIDYQPFSSKDKQDAKTYRLVVMRCKKDHTQLDVFTQDNMTYRSILTNDYESSEQDIIAYYNQRGTEERTIDVLNNDFGWKNMPFSFMEENTVFLMVMMICKNIYTWLISNISERFKGLKKTFRLKKFIFRFITVPAKWIKRGRQMILKVFSPKPYEVLQI